MLKNLLAAIVGLAALLLPSCPCLAQNDLTLSTVLKDNNKLIFLKKITSDTINGKSFAIHEEYKRDTVDIADVQYINSENAINAFNHPDIPMKACERYAAPPGDFEKVEDKYEYEEFPWLKHTLTEPGGYFYLYNSKSKKIEKITKFLPYAKTSVHIAILWALLLISILLGAVKSRTPFHKRYGYLIINGLILCTLFIYVHHLPYCLGVAGLFIVIVSKEKWMNFLFFPTNDLSAIRTYHYNEE